MTIVEICQEMGYLSKHTVEIGILAIDFNPAFFEVIRITGLVIKVLVFPLFKSVI